MDAFRRETRYHSKLISDLEMDQLSAIMPNDMQAALLEIIKQFQSPNTTEQEKEQLFANCQDLMLKAKSMDLRLSKELNSLSKTRDVVDSVLMSNRMVDRLARIQTEEAPFEPLFPIPKSDKPLLKPVHEQAIPSRDIDMDTITEETVVEKTTPAVSSKKVPAVPDPTPPQSIQSLQDDVSIPVQPKTTIDQAIDVSPSPSRKSVQQSATPKIRPKTESASGQEIDESVTVSDSIPIVEDKQTVPDLNAENETLTESKPSDEPQDSTEHSDENTGSTDRQSRIQDYISSDQQAGSTISVQEGDAYHEDSSDEDF